MNCIVRRATREDIPQIVDLERQCSTAAHWNEQQYRDLFETGRTHVECLALVSQRDSQDGILGFLVVRRVHSEWELENLVVYPQIRRQGVGTLLMTEFLREAANQPVFLEVRESNMAARRLYEKLGFQQSGRRKSYYSNPVEDAILYTRENVPGRFSG